MPYVGNSEDNEPMESLLLAANYDASFLSAPSSRMRWTWTTVDRAGNTLAAMDRGVMIDVLMGVRHEATSLPMVTEITDCRPFINTNLCC